VQIVAPINNPSGNLKNFSGLVLYLIQSGQHFFSCRSSCIRDLLVGAGCRYYNYTAERVWIDFPAPEQIDHFTSKSGSGATPAKIKGAKLSGTSAMRFNGGARLGNLQIGLLAAALARSSLVFIPCCSWSPGRGATPFSSQTLDWRYFRSRATSYRWLLSRDNDELVKQSKRTIVTLVTLRNCFFQKEARDNRLARCLKPF